jgi:ATP-dependent phosphoenolpyruvate carboxykinase
VGERPPVEYTQASVKAIIRGELEGAVWTKHPVFGFEYLAREGNEHLDPRLLVEDIAWENPQEQYEQTIELAKIIRGVFDEKLPVGSHPLRDQLAARLPQIPSEPIEVFAAA